ncbi:hypothetical protein ACGF3C_19460 [Micromonospora sp. NPDC047762]|uniref:hypothetical protein n=1 Tax=Micromonospora sp. NPDC047762 TaxID=3364255 RepID=UPI0037172567
MATPTLLARRISFELSELSAYDAHHEFEHLCRELSKARLVSNVLPATGPVAAGGDQGRDFETFHTYLATGLRFATGFLGLATSDTVVFACTLQRDNLKSKIKSDLKSICTQGTEVQRVYFFASSPVPVAQRHDLQKFARDNYQVELEILDGLAIAELLTGPDIFWIAETYLRLTADLRPPSPSGEPPLPGWYTALKLQWTVAERVPVNHGDFSQLVRGLRHATDTREARSDLATWLSLVEQFLAGGPDSDTAQRARYEIARATLRGTGDLRPAEHHVRAFFAEITSMAAPAALLDASVLLQYATTATLAGEAALDHDELRNWATELRQHLTTLLEGTAAPGRRVGLLNAAASLSLHIDYGALPQRWPEGDPILDLPGDAPDDLEGIAEIPAWVPLVDVGHAMSCLAELVGLLAEAPTYPVDSLANYFDMIAPILADHPLYDRVRGGLDEVTSRQSGDAAKAQRCRARAISMCRSGNWPAALRDLHEAKVAWWHGDTMRDALLSMRFISRVYSELAMPLAAKQYGLSVAYLAGVLPQRDLTDLVPAGLFAAANADHSTGAWLSALRMTHAAVVLHTQFAADPWDFERHQDLPTATAHAAMIQAAARHRPQLAGPVTQLIADAGLAPFVDGLLAEDRTQWEWDEGTWRAQAERDLSGAPFCDAAPIRVFQFEALGQRWSVRCRNARPLVVAAEEFCAAAQILLVELATADPVLLPTTVDIDCELFAPGDEPAERAQPIPDNTCSRWKVHLPSEAPESPEEINGQLLPILVQILGHNSLLPEGAFMKIVEGALGRGLAHKLTTADSYRRMTAFFTREADPTDGVHADPLGDTTEPFPFTGAVALAAPTTPGPGYDWDAAERMIKERYTNASAMTRHTLPQAMGDASLREHFADLLADGRREWHLLMALANLVLNHRMLVGTGSVPSRVTKDDLIREEQADDPMPSNGQIREQFGTFLATGVISAANSWGLQVNQVTPDIAAIEALLKTRYRYWDDDIDHVPVLPVS